MFVVPTSRTIRAKQDLFMFDQQLIKMPFLVAKIINMYIHKDLSFTIINEKHQLNPDKKTYSQFY